ncbi:MAG: sigma-70 family RNA polymerase sigma factor [Bacilli bacterium]
MVENEFLPSVLSKEEEEKYINLLSAGSKEAERKLILHNLRLVGYIADQFDNVSIYNCERNDFFSLGTIGLINGVRSFDPNKKVKLATYVSKCIYNEILLYLRFVKKRSKEISMNNITFTDNDGNNLSFKDMLIDDNANLDEIIIEKEEKEIVKEKLNLLTERDQEILKLKYGFTDDELYTDKEIGKLIGLSQTQVTKLKKKALLKLKDMLMIDEKDETVKNLT